MACLVSSDDESTDDEAAKVTFINPNSISQLHVGNNIYYGNPTGSPTDSHEIQASLTDLRKKMSTMLQLRYQNANLPPVPWLDDQLFPVEDFFVELSLVKKKKSGKHINQPIQLKNILESDKGNFPHRILIEGGPGYGKTTITKKLAYDWATESLGYLNGFDLVFVVRLRTLQTDVFSLILEEGRLKNVSTKNVQDAILLHPEKVLLILDGYDEMNASHRSEVLEDPSLLLMTVIMTSRPSEVSYLRKTFQKIILVQGISDRNREIFIKNYLHSVDLPQKNYNSLQNYLKDNTLDELCVCPLLLSLICLLVTDKDFSLPQTKTELYQNFLDFIVKRSLRKIDSNSDEVDLFGRRGQIIPTKVAVVLKTFGNYVLQTLNDHKFIFSEEEILLSCRSDPLILQLGILYKHETIQNRKVIVQIEPIHLTFLEFLAGYALAESDVKEKYLSLANSHPQAFIFMAGLIGIRFPQVPPPLNGVLFLNMLIETKNPMRYMKTIHKPVRDWNLKLRRHFSKIRRVPSKENSSIFRAVEREYLKYLIQNEYLLSLRVEFSEDKASLEDFELKTYIPELSRPFVIPNLRIYMFGCTSADDVIMVLKLLHPKTVVFSTKEEHGRYLPHDAHPKLISRCSIFGKIFLRFKLENFCFSSLKFTNASLTRKDIKNLANVLTTSPIEHLFLHGLNVYSQPSRSTLTPLFPILEQPNCRLRELHLLYVNIFQTDVDDLCLYAGRSQSLVCLELRTGTACNIHLLNLCNESKEWESITLQCFRLILPNNPEEHRFKVKKLVSHDTVVPVFQQKDEIKTLLESCGVEEIFIK